MHEYRCTRNSKYTSGVGQIDLTARQGYYVRAASTNEAFAKMRLAFPEDTEGFTVEFWRDKCKSLKT
jgi:hypothetical protein